MTEGLTVERVEHIARLILDRPEKRNAITWGMWDALPGLVAEIEADSDVKVLVVRGRDDHFSAGADISEFESRRADAASAQTYNETVQRAEEALATFTKPSIAQLQGYCLGGGCEIAAACDVRFAAPDAVLGITPSKLGLVYGFSSTRSLVELVGPSYAKYLLFSGVQIPAHEALRAGLVDQVSDDAIGDYTEQFARTVASRSQVSVRGAKVMIGKVVAGLSTPDDEARTLPIEAVESLDYREGVRAFLEKRPAQFTMR